MDFYDQELDFVTLSNNSTAFDSVWFFTALRDIAAPRV